MIKFTRWLVSPHVLLFLGLMLKVLVLRYLLLGDRNPLNLVLLELPIFISIFFIISLLMRSWSAYFLLFLNLCLSFLFVSMLLYERYFNIIPSYYDFNQIGQAGSVSGTALKLLSPVDVLFFADFLLIALSLVLFKRKGKTKSFTANRKIVAALLSAFILLSAFTIYYKKDEPFMDSGIFAKENGLVNSQIIQAFHRSAHITAMADYEPSLSDEEILSMKGNEFIPAEDHAYFGAAKDRHLIAIQVESLQDFVINMELNGQVITPFLNELVEESLYFDEVYQQIGAGNTSDTEVLFNMSVYPSGLEPTVNDIKRTQSIPSLPNLLSKHGYHTSTYHADDVTYWNRNNLYPALGFDQYYDISYFGEEDLIGIWPSDKILFEKSLEAFDNIVKENEKMYSNVITVTSHTPFELPEELQGLNLPEEFEGTLIGNYLQSIHYTDQQLKNFADGLKEKGLWNQSLITLFGDHSGVHGTLLTEKDADLLRSYFGRGYSLVDRFNVPFIVTVPGVIEGQKINHTGGQIDMMPTILNLLGIVPNEMRVFGHNLLEYEKNLLGMRYYLPLGSFINNEVMFSERSAKRADRMYELTTSNAYTADEREKLLNVDYKEDKENVLRLMKASDEYVNHLLSP
ncbi:LTA synthase family protein [Jeotgalibacillus proteolyticus]|uniref:LTA synthase family protein n=1 Tax=Jeotgalibacillus proteolyticus TaxID=2082395 RepID=UPI003CEFC20F